MWPRLALVREGIDNIVLEITEEVSFLRNCKRREVEFHLLFYRRKER